MPHDQISRSFELAAERCDDLTPLVYASLFRQHPELEQFFVMDKTGAARGSMLSWVINALLDGGERGSYGDNLFRAEVVNHSGMGVEPHQFVLFFAALADTLKDLLAADWTPAIETAWRDKLEVLDALVRNPA